MSAPRGPQRCSLARVLAVLCVWAGAAAVALLVAAETAFGPVVLTLSENHGVHAGDIVAVGGMAIVAMSISAVILRPCFRPGGSAAAAS